jgi:hypothetical protein
MILRKSTPLNEAVFPKSAKNPLPANFVPENLAQWGRHYRRAKAPPHWKEAGLFLVPTSNRWSFDARRFCVRWGREDGKLGGDGEQSHGRCRDRYEPPARSG